MRQVVVVTDSSGNLPPRLIPALGIRVVPIVLVLGGHSYRDGSEITASDVYRWLGHGGHSPTTSAPSVGDFVRTYTRAAQQASGIVSIHLSPKLSATYEAAAAAGELVDAVPFRVIACPTAAMGLGFVVLEAARAAAAGADLDQVVARAEEIAPRVHLLATIGTLEYLHRGGRIGGAASLLGAALQIKPVLSLADGQVAVLARPRSKASAVHTMLQQVEDISQGHPIHAAVLHADVPEEAENLRQRVAARFDCRELYVTELTPVMGAHTGPGVLGIAFYTDSLSNGTPIESPEDLPIITDAHRNGFNPGREE